MKCALKLVLLYGGLYSIYGEILTCDFQDINFQRNYGSYYTCIVTGLENPFNNKTIDGYKGDHEANRTNEDVKFIYSYWTDVDYIPAEMGLLYQITGLFMQFSELKEIEPSSFEGMEELEILDLSSNRLTTLPADCFEDLHKLRIVAFTYNQLEGLPADLFMMNTKLESIDFVGNYITYIAPDLFDFLPKVTFITFHLNFCLNKIYNGTTAIAQIKHDISVNCYVPTTTGSNPITTSGTVLSKPKFPMQELIIIVILCIIMLLA